MRAVSAVLGWLVVLVFGVAVVHAFTQEPPPAPVAPVWGSAAGDMSAAAPAEAAAAVPVQAVKAPKTARAPRTARVRVARVRVPRVSPSHRVRSVRAGAVLAPPPVQVVIVQVPAPAAVPVVLVVPSAPVVS